MKNKKVIGILILGILLISTLVGCGNKSTKVNFLEELNEVDYVVSAFENNEGIIKANLTGVLSEEVVKDIAKKIYIKAKDEKVKEKEVILNIFEDGENKEFKEDIYEGMNFNLAINLKDGTYTLKSINKIENVEVGDELGNATNNKLISVKDNNLEIGIDMKLDEFSKEEALKRMKTYVQLFLNMNSDKDIKSIKLNVNNKENNTYIYDTEKDDLLVIVDKDVEIKE